MQKILLAVDGSDNAMRAVAHLIKRTSMVPGDYEIHLVNVQHPLHGGISSFINAAQIKQYHHDEGMNALARARGLLDAAGLAYGFHLFVGEPAEVIARYAREQQCDEVIIGTHGLSAISSILVGSVAIKVIHLSEVPVLLVK